MPRRAESKNDRAVHEFPAPESDTDLIFRAQEEERKRISRELHDEMGQGLMTLRLALGSLLKDSPEDAGSVRIQEALDILDDTIDGLRRIIARLSPRLIDDLGLLGAIRREAELVSKLSGMKAQMTLPKELPELSRGAEVAVYRCIQEALHNIARHSNARRFELELTASGDNVTISIQDDGQGFGKPIPYTGHFGLTGMRERVEELGGTMRIASARNKGSQIQIEVPLASSAGPATAEPHRALSGKAS